MPPRKPGLTEKQRAFVMEYLVDLNATQAAIRAHYSEATAKEMGYENLTKPHIAEAIQAAMHRRAARTEVTADRVIKEYARLAFTDMRSYFEWGETSAQAVPSEDLSDDDAAAVAEIVVTETAIGELAVKRTIKLKLHDKKGSLDALARHLKLDAAKERHAFLIEEGEADAIDTDLNATITEMETRYVNGTTPDAAEG